jgi:uncharacterized CHY-type Zn-finger protein
MGSHEWKLGDDEWYHCRFCPEVVHQELFRGEDVTLIKHRDIMHGFCTASLLPLDHYPRVDCCEEGSRYMTECQNDQIVDPEYRHIRINIITPSGSVKENTRIRFCPFCGTEYKIVK